MRISAEEVKNYEGDSAGFGDNRNDGANRKASFEIDGSPSPSSPSPFSPLSVIESISRKSLSYSKLPLEPIKLTVLKLDGSSFDITVEQKATVVKLKQAVEAAFSHLPKHGIDKVSWPHVWGEFCLCFEGQKLLHDGDSIRLYGIQDGVQLQFVRHTSITYNFVKERSENQDSNLEESVSPSKQDSYKHKLKNDSNCEQDGLNEQNHDGNDKESCDDVGVNITCQCTLAHLLRRLFSYRRLKRHDKSGGDIGASSPLLV